MALNLKWELVSHHCYQWGWQRFFYDTLKTEHILHFNDVNVVLANLKEELFVALLIELDLQYQT